MFTGTGNENRCLAGKGAFCLAYPAADAVLVNNIRLFQSLGLLTALFYFNIVKANSFLRSWTMLFTDHARHVLCVGQTPVFIEPGMADLSLLFFLQRQMLNSPSRAYLAAQCAVELTIANPGHQGWTEEAIDSCPQKRRLQGIAYADL